MACSKHQGKQGRDLPEVREGEPALIFCGPKMRKGQCVQVTVRNKQFKYLVRYPRSGGNSTAPRGVVTDPQASPVEPPVAPGPDAGPEPGPVPSGPSTVSRGTSCSSSSSSSPSPSRRRRRLSSSSSSSTSSSSSSSTCGSCSSTTSSGSDNNGGHRSSGSSGSSSSSLEIAVPLWTPSGSSGGEGPSTSNLGLQTSAIEEGHLSVVVLGDWEYEWVPEGRVLRYSAAHVQDSDAALQMAAKREQLEDCPVTSTGGNDEGNVGKGSSIWWGAVMQWPLKRKRERGRKRRRRGDERAAVDPEEKYLNRLEEVRVHLPKALKPLIVEDWELVTLGKKLFILPAKKTVAAILLEYATFQQNYGTATKKHTVNELMAGLQDYFDVVLGNQLLYDFEKPQHSEILASYPTMLMSQIYGGAHLLRLFPQMGPMLACTSLNDSSLDVLQNHLQDFLQYLATDPSRLFSASTDYQEASAEYQQKTKADKTV